MDRAVPLAPYIYALGAYVALQLLLNLVLRQYMARHPNKAQAMLTGTFWAGVLNAMFFISVAVAVHGLDAAPNALAIPANFWLLALYGLPAGVLVWYVSVYARKLGLRLFGRGELIASEDAILRLPPHPRYLSLGLANLALLQPLGRELFFRGALFPAALLALQHAAGAQAWVWATLVVLVLELLLRLNVVWVFQTIAYVVLMCVMFQLTGYALTGLVAAMTAGLLHGVALAYIGQQDLRRLIQEQTRVEDDPPVTGRNPEAAGEPLTTFSVNQ